MGTRALICTVVAALGAVVTAPAAAAGPATLDAAQKVTFGSLGAFGDVDGDGLKDAVSLDKNPDINYSRQSPRGVFGSPVFVTDPPFDSSGEALLLADVAGDRRAEQVVALAGDHEIAYMQPADALRLPADGRVWIYRQITRPSEDRTVVAASAGDVTGDGRSDAVLITRAAGEGSRVVVVQNRSGFPDASESPAAPGGLETSLDLADVDRDGVLDVIATSRGRAGYIRVAAGSPGAWQALPGTEALAGLQYLRIGSFNGDAVSDLATIQYTLAGPRFAVFVGRPGRPGAPDYDQVPLAVPPGTPCAIDAGRLNNDASDDLVLLTGCDAEASTLPVAGRMTTLLNDGTGSFGRPEPVPPISDSLFARGVAIDDLDGDGLGEVVSEWTDTSTVVYMNRTVVVPPPPPPGCPPGCTDQGKDDAAAPKVTIRRNGRAWKATGTMRVTVGCDEPCSLFIKAQLFFSRGPRGRVVASLTLPAPNRGRPIYANRSTRATVPFELKAARRAAARRYLRRGLYGLARFTISASDGRNAKTYRASVRVTR